MNNGQQNRITVGSGETHVRAFGADVMATPDPTVRFWIITVVLVLFGLSTLKLR
jgi:UDP-N-acetylmuramyl pentapeptide phosphotransferase/UDP-N-acetylglucosamine-1-phosphate transferase